MGYIYKCKYSLENQILIVRPNLTHLNILQKTRERGLPDYLNEEDL